MEKEWTKIETYTVAIQAEFVKQMLVENGIPAVVINKQDSSYFFGKIELFVQNDYVDQAKVLIAATEEEGKQDED